MRDLIKAIAIACLPSRLRAHLLGRGPGSDISGSAYVGRSLFLCSSVQIGDSARIGDFNVFRRLSTLRLDSQAVIGNRNWVTAIPAVEGGVFGELRNPSLVIGRGAAISSGHYIDCQDSVSVGRYSIIAGVGSQIWTHGIDVVENRQVANPVSVGAYCYIGSRAVLLGGAVVPDFCVVAAAAVVTSALAESYRLYAGSPARAVKELPRDAQYFLRTNPYVS